MVNAERALTNELKPIEAGESPGLIFFQYGKNKEGYWDGALFQAQCNDFINVIEILHPDMQILLEVDHSSGHLKEQSNGLMVNTMGLRWGGKTTPKRDSIIEEGCLGEDVPLINRRRLQIGMIQRMIFVEGDPPPFLDSNARPHDVPMNEEEKAKEMAKRKKRKDSSNSTLGPDVEAAEEYAHPGYIGKNKGIFQVSCH